MTRLFLPLVFALVGCATPHLQPLNVPARPSGKAGSVLVTTPMRGAPHGAVATRFAYVSRDIRGNPVPVSGVLIVPDRPAPQGGRNLVVWAHATTGVAKDCAPSLHPKFFHRVPGLQDFLARDIAVVTTDYPGLGTPGVHPYLVGASEGRAVLDAARAARRLTALNGKFAVWGHSQGGQAALFAGEMAAGAAPGLRLVGVAAAAPATDLATLLDDDIATPVGKILACYTLWSWSKVYGLDPHSILNPENDAVVQQIVGTCVEGPGEALAIAREEGRLKDRFVLADPTKTEPWKTLMETNRPGRRPAGAPLFLAQGTKDGLVRPEVTEEFARAARARGTPVDFVWLQNVDHNHAGHIAAPQAAAWIAERFAAE